MSLHKKDTEERIRKAASRIFSLRGFEGARMQEIADEARINKAMLHYYFRSKKMLFDMILDEKITQIFVAFSEWFTEERSFEEKLRAFVQKQITIVSEFPVLPLFILSESRKNPEIINQKFQKVPIQKLRASFHKMIDEAYQKGEIRKITLEELLVNTMSLCVYPIVAAPILQHVLDLDDIAYKAIIEKRKDTVAELLLRDLAIIKASDL